MTPPASGSERGVSISDDAKGLAACLWGTGIAEKTILSFGMQEVRPTARAQAALDELVAAGLLYHEPKPGGGMSYGPCGDMRAYRRFSKLGNFLLTEKIER
jgi:hypothetical protein